MVDTGSTYSYIDADLVAALAKQFSATIDDSGVYYVSCDYLKADGYVHFGFNHGNMVINAKYSDFIVDFGTRCALGVQPADAGVNTWVLGSTFIRSAYSKFQTHPCFRFRSVRSGLTSSSCIRSDVRCNLARELSAMWKLTRDGSHRERRKPALV